jgi:hypothetical protein
MVAHASEPCRRDAGLASLGHVCHVVRGMVSRLTYSLSTEPLAVKRDIQSVWTSDAHPQSLVKYIVLLESEYNYHAQWRPDFCHVGC